MNTWEELFVSISLTAQAYWKGMNERKKRKSDLTTQVYWEPPLLVVIKLNFDAAFEISRDYIRVVLIRNDKGKLLGALIERGIAADMNLLKLKLV